jgi:bile acid-coenzyme A ligase
MTATVGDTKRRPSMGRRITMLAEAAPGETAIVFAPVKDRERTISWSELDHTACRMARLLQERGVDEHSLVAIALPNCPDHFFAAIAAWKLGACVLPLRPDLPTPERLGLIEVARPCVIVGDWDTPGVESLARDRIADLSAFSASPLPERVPNPAMAIASGGSTGRPKVIVTPGSGLAPGPAREEAAPDESVKDFVPSSGDQVQLIPSPLYHAAGFRGSHHSLLLGQRIVVMDRFSPEHAVDLVERHHVNNVNMVPTMLLRIARLPGIERRDLSSLASVMASAASCPAWVARKWCELVGPEHFVISYGASEFTGMAMVRGDEWLQHPGTVGRGLGTDIRVLDDDGNAVPAGEVGEVFMRPVVDVGPTYEYRGAEQAKTADGGFVSVGDLGWLDADGFLYIADRRADMIVTGGANVYPAEVEAALSEHPRVADVAVVGIADDEWGRRVHAIVQAVDRDDPPAIAELDRHCRERLAAYKAPKSYEFVHGLPRTEAGKLNRSSLAAAREAGAATRSGTG